MFKFVQSDILLENYDCPVCLETRSSLYQTGFGFLYPFALAPLSAFMFATRHFTYRLPSITEKPKEILRLWWKFTRSIGPAGSVLLALNVVASIAVTAKEMREFSKITLEIADTARKAELGEELEL